MRGADTRGSSFCEMHQSKKIHVRSTILLPLGDKMPYNRTVPASTRQRLVPVVYPCACKKHTVPQALGIRFKCCQDAGCTPEQIAAARALAAKHQPEPIEIPWWAQADQEERVSQPVGIRLGGQSFSIDLSAIITETTGKKRAPVVQMRKRQ